jgi:hypothetical protein
MPAPRPRGGAEADIPHAMTLTRGGALSAKSLSLNLPNKYIHEGEVEAALSRMLSTGLIEVLGGRYQLNAAAARDISRKAGEEERRLASRFDAPPPVFSK